VCKVLILCNLLVLSRLDLGKWGLTGKQSRGNKNGNDEELAFGTNGAVMSSMRRLFFVAAGSALLSSIARDSAEHEGAPRYSVIITTAAAAIAIPMP